MSESGKLDLNLLNIFLEVFRLKSITLAADSLGMTQPGVSGALKRLQQQIGTDLFIREGRGITPTNAAIQLAIQIEPALQGINSAIGTLKQFDNQQYRQFRILVNESALAKIQPIVEADQTLGKIAIEFNMVPNNEEDLLNSLSMQKADLAIDIHYPKVNGYKTQKVQDDELVLIARKGHPRIDGTIDQVQFYSEKHVTFRMRRSNQYTADYFTTLPLKERKISAECDSLIAMCALISASDCIGSTSRYIANRFANQFQLQVLALPFETIPVQQYMIWHKRTDNHPSHQWLRDKILQYLKSSQ
ncbi:LysR family transcriptional regulator [Vibrio sinensis]|uniref:LysR family transcriptional regulator n=1 Tax=Vibrio sinensis TaxID=2302434 RepID=A0A3A6QXA5_9VIBR|nr:LysR family transcriptional regulator [Vibrio sinensis]RJX75176.1 LysR family transcriptional regulator [Vibrio sinensis]